ncbi:hypothetical protein EON77_01905 [bacterium]|nr:MAG: hypothetical protein EON77_01905 [bacterium]
MANEPYDDALWSFVTVSVDETLKGPRRTEVRFAVRIWNDPEARALDRWRTTGAPLLVSLRTSRKFDDPYAGVAYESARYEFVLRSGTVEDSIVPLLDGAPSVVTMDPALLDSAKAILVSARAETRASDLVDQKSGAGIFRAEIPSEWKDHLGSGFDHMMVTMPVGPRLERRARAWLVARDPRLNWWGVRALGLFRTEANARLLRRCRATLPLELPSRDSSWNGGPNGEMPPDAELLPLTRAEIDRILRAWNLPKETTMVPKTRVRG